MRGKSKRRLALGEEKWVEYQTQRAERKNRRWYQSNKSHTSLWRIRIKQQLIAYKGGKCQRCGYDRDVPGAYTFHHRDPRTKEFALAGYVGSLERAKREADKCNLLCCNCHAEVHDEERRDDRQCLYKELAARLNKKLNEKNCEICGQVFKPHKRSQRKCSKQCSRKVQTHPTESEMIHMMENMTWKAIGQKYGVTDTAVRKWAKQMSITWKAHSRQHKFSNTGV